MANKINKLILLGMIILFASCDEFPEVDNNIPTLQNIQALNIQAESVRLHARATYHSTRSYFLLSYSSDMDDARYFDASPQLTDDGNAYNYYASVDGLQPGIKYFYKFILVNDSDSDMRIESETMDLTTDTQYRQYIVWNTSYNQYLGDEPFTLNAYATSKLPVTYTIIEGTCARLEGDRGQTFVILSNGTVVVQASQSGNENYHAAEPVTKSITIKDNKLIITDVKVDSWGSQNGGSSNVEI